MEAMLRHVATIGTDLVAFVRRSRSSNEPILACWFLSWNYCRRDWGKRPSLVEGYFQSQIFLTKIFVSRSGKVKLPEWVDIVKTNVAKELAPFDEDWYYTRLASIARHIYIRSPVGVSTVCKIYGGKITFRSELVLKIIRFGVTNSKQ